MAWAFGFPPSEFERMTWAQLERWGDDAARIAKQLRAKR